MGVGESTTSSAVCAPSDVRPRENARHLCDRRVVRSRVALRDALIELTEQRGLENITVGDLCDRAGLTRGTFYNHFRDKEDLITSFEAEVLADLEAIQGQLSGLNLPQILACQVAHKPLPILVELFEYLAGEGRFLNAMLGPGGDIAFAPRLRDSVCTNVISCMLHKRYRENPTAFVNYYVAFFASAYLGIITRWLEDGMPESPREMAIISMRLLFIKPGESITL